MRRTPMLPVVVSLLAAGSLVVACSGPRGAGPIARRATTADPAHGFFRPARSATTTPPSRWIAVSVATLWVSPGQARPVDAPSLGNPAYPRKWIEGMTVAQKRWLVGKLETQALFGTRVYLLGTSGTWSHVAVTGQPTPRSRRGYPGWLPTVQLFGRAPASTGQIAVVRVPTTFLYADPSSIGTTGGRVMEVSYDTRFPVARVTATSIEVILLGTRHVFLARNAATVHRTGSPWPTITGPQAVTEAKRFLGLQYLWAGTSGLGFDCSGLTHTVYDALGRVIPRDADAQFATGTKVDSRAALRPGDLVFFRNSEGYVHHVGMYVGDGKMIHSPGTGYAVQITSLYVEPYFSEFAGGRRYVPSERPVRRSP